MCRSLPHSVELYDSVLAETKLWHDYHLDISCYRVVFCAFEHHHTSCTYLFNSFLCAFAVASNNIYYKFGSQGHLNMEDSSGSVDAGGQAIPAWKLRMMQNKDAKPIPSKTFKKKDNFDAPLPPAFKAVRKQRLAFAKQQERRKNNDTWVSLNSSHPDKEPSEHIEEVQYDSFDSDDDSFASMGEESYEVEVIEEGEDEDQPKE